MPTPPPPPTSNVSYYYPPKYAHHQQQSAFQYQSNQFLPQSHAVAPYFPSTSAFESVHVWPHQQQLYTTPLYSTSFDHHQSPLQSATQNGYFYNGLDRAGLYYGSHMPIAGNSSSSAVPTPSSSTCSEHNWPIPSKSENANHFDTTPVLYGQNGNRSSDTNHMTNSLNVDGSFDVTSQNNREVPMLDVKSRSLEMDARKKKIPRPMNSFMIYAKRHRAHVHQLYPLCDNRTISKILSDTWYSMDAEKKREYNELALEMRQEHFRLYPNFKWKTTSNETNEAQRKNSPTTTTVEPNVQSTALPEQHRMVGSDDSSEAFSGFQFDEYGDLVSPYMPATPSTETSLSPVGCGDKPLDDESKISQAIRLGPTPAQLGMCRNKKQSKGNASATGEDGNGINEDGLAMVSNQSQFKERFLNLPKFDFSNYRQTSEWDTSPTPAAITYNTTIRKRKSDTDQQQQQQTHHQLQPAKRLIGNRFFGPDFNVNHFKGKIFFVNCKTTVFSLFEVRFIHFRFH